MLGGMAGRMRGAAMLLPILLLLSVAFVVPGVGAAASFSTPPPATQSTPEDTPLVFPAIVVSATDANVAFDIAVSNGTVALNSTAGLNNCSGANNSAAMRFRGSVAAVNAALNGITFTPTTDFNGNAAVVVGLRDNSGNPCSSFSAEASAQTAITVTAVNDAPKNTVPGAQTIDQGTTLTFSTANGNAISIADVDAGTSDVRVNLSVGTGTLTLGGVTGLDFSCGACSGTGTGDTAMTFRGKIAAINAALQGLVYNPASNYSSTAAPFVLTIKTNDLGNNGDGGNKVATDTVNIIVRANTVITGVSGSATYGGGDATFTATLNRTDGNVSLTGKTIDFYLNGTLVGSGVTGANGNPANVATFSGTIATPLAVGNYAGAVEAKFAGEADYAPSSATGAFKVKKRILWVQPKPQSRAANAANPGCASVADVQPFAPAPANTGLVNGDTLETAVAAPTGFFGCTYGVTNGTAAKPSKPGTYTIIASGLTSQNYDVRYKSGTLTVTP